MIFFTVVKGIVLLLTTCFLVEGTLQDAKLKVDHSLSARAPIISSFPTFQLRREPITTTFPPLNPGSHGTGNPSTTAFKALQMNLCNSGWASCYKSGKSISSGSATIKSISPNLVTVNEICSNDVSRYLQPTLAAVWPQDWTFGVFMPAIVKSNDSAYHCTNGDYYGSAVIGRVAASSWNGVKSYGGKYSSQWTKTQEERIFACVDTGNYFACTTHLAAADDKSVEQTALAQCRALMYDVVPYLRGLAGVSSHPHTVIGGDFNLEYDTDDPENVQNCIPVGYTRKGDGDVQHIVISNDFVFKGAKKVGVDNTDHPAWIGDLAIV